MSCTADHSTSILVIDDEPGMYKCVSRMLQPDFSVHAATSGEEGLMKADTISPDLILLDLIMPGMSGMEVLRKLTQSKDIPVIVFTRYGSIDSAVRSIKLGAVDYIEKPFDSGKLNEAVNKVLEGRESYRKLPICQNITGESPQIQKVWQLIERYGPTDLPILLQGETGTGKELFAKAIHEISKRKQEAFVPVDCSTLPETLFESEIFGYERGAFTGANTRKPGQLDWADKGTFFLDEVPNLSMIYQAKLLRILQERQYTPLGARSAKAVDVRFVSSSNVDLRETVRSGVFREDLYYRVAGVCIELPPLRKREGDIELLARHFVDEYARRYDRPTPDISNETMELLLSYTWPGNVRELEYTIAAAVVGAGRTILPQHFASRFRMNSQRASPISMEKDNGKVKFELGFSCDITKPIDLKELKNTIAAEVEGLVITEVKKTHNLSQTDMARFLGIDPKTLRSKERC
jgi:two-component system response regulator AtoC